MLDLERGCYYLWARYYDPKVGRFISEDTYKGAVDNPLTLNRYTYVHNNPINNIDPTGNYCVSADGKNAYGGGCNNLTSKYLGDDITGGPIISNGKLTGYISINGPGTLDKTNYWDSYGYVPGLGSIRFGKEFDMGVKGWSVRFDKGMVGTCINTFMSSCGNDFA